MRYALWIADFREPSDFWTHMALPGLPCSTSVSVSFNYPKYTTWLLHPRGVVTQKREQRVVFYMQLQCSIFCCVLSVWCENREVSYGCRKGALYSIFVTWKWVFVGSISFPRFGVIHIYIHICVVWHYRPGEERLAARITEMLHAFCFSSPYPFYRKRYGDGYYRGNEDVWHLLFLLRIFILVIN